MPVLHLSTLFLGSVLLAVAEVCIRADGNEKRRHAARAGGGAGSQGGGDAATASSLATRAQSRLPQLLLEDFHLMLTQETFCINSVVRQHV